MIHVDKNGNTRRVTAQQLFASNRWELVGRRGLLTNAIREDEDIALFITKKEVLEKLERCRLKNEYIFTCPFCGEEFVRKIGDMIGRTPKCPRCKDLGLYKEQIANSETEGYFLTTMSFGKLNEASFFELNETF